MPFTWVLVLKLDQFQGATVSFRDEQNVLGTAISRRNLVPQLKEVPPSSFMRELLAFMSVTPDGGDMST